METQALTKPDKVHQLISRMWRKPKTGYCWVDNKFGSSGYWMHNEKTMDLIIACLTSKREGLRCSFHHRTHGPI